MFWWFGCYGWWCISWGFVGVLLCLLDFGWAYFSLWVVSGGWLVWIVILCVGLLFGWLVCFWLLGFTLNVELFNSLLDFILCLCLLLRVGLFDCGVWRVWLLVCVFTLFWLLLWLGLVLEECLGAFVGWWF